MTKQEYMDFHESCCKKMVEITKAKNADYTGTSEDPFSNFNRVKDLGVCTTEQGFLVRMTDKLCRINSFVQKGFLLVKDESVEDTLLDLANYCILFAGYIKSRKLPPTKTVQEYMERAEALEDGRPKINYQTGPMPSLGGR